ncbi:hypothetical protein BOX15_Mlig017393g3 [Macrostomum lignano]|nr:hypothetical protein BOX15_Mlig017393g3 [Macrostomum lignano]
MSGAFMDASCGIGLIMGTGSNVCYMERICNIPKWQSLTGHSPSEFQEYEYVIVNTEWGAFGDNGVIKFLKTEFDFQLDNESLYAGTYTFEKLFSGMYLGELARVTLVKLCDEGLVFGGQPSPALLTPGSFPSSFISRVEQDNHRDLSQTYRCLKELKLSSISDEDYHVVRYLANALSVRAAQIVAAGLSVFVERVQRTEVAIAVDGSLFTKHPVLPGLIQEFLDKYCPRTHTRLIHAEDGSGKGAAFTAAVVDRFRRDETSNGE